MSNYKRLVLERITDYHNRTTVENFDRYINSMKNRVLYSSKIKIDHEGSPAMEINYHFTGVNKNKFPPYNWNIQCYYHTSLNGKRNILIEEAHIPLYKELYEMLEEAGDIEEYNKK